MTDRENLRVSLKTQDSRAYANLVAYVKVACGFFGVTSSLTPWSRTTALDENVCGLSLTMAEGDPSFSELHDVEKWPCNASGS